MATPTVLSTTVTAGSGVAVGAKQSGGMAIIGPLDASATVAADVVKPYTNAAAVTTDHFAGSLIDEASKAAFGAKTPPIWIGAFADKAQPAIATRTFGDMSILDTGTLPSSLLPFYNAGAVTIDGVAYDRIIYTTQVPSASTFPTLGDTPPNLELAVNPKTGVFYSGLATTGSGAGIVFGDATTGPKSPDWAKLREIIAGKPVDIVYLAGWEEKPQYWAVIDSHATWAATSKMRVSATLPDGIGSTGDGTAGGLDTFNDHADGDTVSELVGAMLHDNLHLTAYHKSSTFPSGFDIGAAFAAHIAGLGQNGSTALKPVPESVRTYIDTLQEFTASEYGALVSPAANTLHNVGVNAIVLDTSNRPKWSSLRTTKAYDATGNFNFNDFDTRGRINRVTNLFAGVVDNWVAGAPTSGLFDDRHLARLRDRLISESIELYEEGTITQPVSDSDLFIPTFADTLSSDRAINTLTGAYVNVTIGKVVLKVNLELGVVF